MASQITGIQDATGEAIGAIDGVARTFTESNEIAGSIAAAVEEQGAATADISIRDIQRHGLAGGPNSEVRKIGRFFGF